MQLNQGDMVRSHRYGPLMTVLKDEGCLSNGKQVVTCGWKTKTREQESRFLSDTLLLRKRALQTEVS